MTHQALHLKYRPQKLAELVGQDFIRTALTNAVSDRQIARAYLFTGPRGTGKTSTARILAKSLNCLEGEEPTVTPCGVCASCRAIDNGSALDVSEIDAASHNGVDDARSLIEQSNFAPARGRYRIFILDEAHMLTSASQNALLKVIEEPPARTMFILCTTEAHKVLPTIASRCQTFNFRALSVQTIIDHLREVAELETIDITEEALNAIARTANGGLRDALQLLSQLALLGETITPTRVVEVSGGVSPEELLELLTSLGKGDIIGTLKLARTLVDGGKAPQLILSGLLQVYRDLLLVKSAPKSKHLVTSAIAHNKLRSLANGLDFPAIDAALTQLQKSEAQLKTSLNASIWLEVCLLNLMPETAIASLEPPSNGSKLSSATESASDLAGIWANVVETAKPSNRGLLSRARLAQLDEERAVLSVEPKYIKRFQQRSQTVERILDKALGYAVTVEIEAK
ncbi:DNA polymerase III subunit gamma/tau [Spirulina sp. 06S082]|uniref:DNA polymerase III subunit gamma/tau n=1 Tax=Spirulina sp. 06S082 TaxID=3110248 RepID=UPI002B218DDC|nr:DNA polymerase III subunit gamma/tau [Spirulina sp. 06S082]MEA5468580.1 DNA polymerase III subunit gamma/tau [Spirulina sp. 06S082]